MEDAWKMGEGGDLGERRMRVKEGGETLENGECMIEEGGGGGEREETVENRECM